MILKFKKMVQGLCQALKAKKSLSEDNYYQHNSYLKLKLICRLCSDKREFQNLTQLRFHVERHEDSFKKEIYQEMLQQ